jgi:ubiquitin carboxyl-terminal hydrolase 36/42
VNAEKRFTIHDAPTVLTVHFKRFSPMGHKIGHGVDYDEHLSLEPFMSDGQYGPRYNLYGIICHAGGGPNSGHYYAYVKSREGRWYEMNDESVTPVQSGGSAPRIKNAYVLFYLKNKGQKLESVMQFSSTGNKKTGLAAAMKKRKLQEEGDDQEDQGEKVSKPFIGPVLPSTPGSDDNPPDPKRPKLDIGDPQADSIKKKIAAAKAAQTALSNLATNYASDDEGPEETGSKLNGHSNSSPPKPQSSPAQPPSNTTGNAIPPSSFYGTPVPKKSSQSRDGSTPADRHAKWKSDSLNPYSNRITTYKKKNRGLARGL